MSGCYIYKVGDLFGAEYVFDRAGQGIARHSHPLRELRHSVTVLSGSVRLNRAVLCAGCTAVIDDDSAHEIVALEPDTRIRNLNLYGCPEIFKSAVHGSRVSDVDDVE